MKKIKKNFIIIFISILFLLFIIDRVFFFKKGFLENCVANISYPCIWLISKVTYPIKKTINEIKIYNQYQNQYKAIKKENNKLLKENIKLKSILHFASKNNELLDFKKRYKFSNSIFAQILLKNFTEEEHYVLINKGHKHGIKKNMIAINKFQILGKVIEVYRWYSKILLLTDRKCKISAFTNSTNAIGISCGQNNTKLLKFEYVSHLSKIIDNDFILSSGQGLIFPEGFCLGKIKSFTKNDLYYDIKIEPLVEIDKIENCLLTNQEKMTIF